MKWEHTRILSESIRWLLGPLTGDPREIISLGNVSPGSLFVTGMIAASQGSGLYIAEDPLNDRDEEDESTLDASPLFSVNPVLHPDKLPASLGLTFTVRSKSGEIKFRACVTWARYLREENQSSDIPEKEGNEEADREKGVWRRHPACEIVDVRLGPDGGELRERLEDELGTLLEFLVRARRKGEESGLFTVSVYLVARRPETETGPDRRPPTKSIIFQPQIRIVLGRECELADMSRDLFACTSTAELFDIPFIREGLEVPARGHMCSVVWKEIDPQQISLEGLPNSIIYPFRWPDGEIVREKYGKEEYETFLRCDLRTEYIPVVEVPAPDLDPEGIPSLTADELAEAWEPERMRELLQPLVDRYGEWIEEREREIDEGDREGRELLNRHRVALDRMQKSLDLLCSDPDVRLAFCFANRAISLQYAWSRGGGNPGSFRWRPFQLGFFLLVLESICDPESEHRKTCDLLWIPTGGGKTEAYLGIIAFTLALRRRKHGESGLGTAVISRYTLRLLGIQQFMRALRLITACEYLRVMRSENGLHGYRPEACDTEDDWLWGKEWFSAGLWVGGRITPNKLRGNPRQNYWGARDILEDAGHDERRYSGGETPAQVTTCPACGSLLAVPGGEEGIPWDRGVIWFAVKIDTENCTEIIRDQLYDRLIQDFQSSGDLTIESVDLRELIPGSAVYALGIRVSKPFLSAEDVRRIWRPAEEFLNYDAGCTVNLLSFSPETPGYFPWGEDDFRIICPSPECYLRQKFTGRYSRSYGDADFTIREKNNPDVRPLLEYSIHIPALTVDEQIYRELPSLLIATVDKFARLPAEPRCGAIFGNVDRFHSRHLFYRSACEDESHRGEQKISGFRPPDLILQDELHLIEGPLGSLTGLYETAVDFLCSENTGPPKYIASTATTRGGGNQIKALFSRDSFLFPPLGLRLGDSFFIRSYSEETGSLFRDPGRKGRIYAGLAAFSWGPLTPQVRLATSVYQAVHGGNFPQNLKAFYRTPVSYYNAIRELAAGLHLFYQDVPDWFRSTGRVHLAHIPDRNRVVELSSRISSGALPFILRELETSVRSSTPPDALLTTSIFGTGVDIPHLSLMIVNGQPKTTSAYIQATGRVGRARTGIVFTLYRISRPRDLSHYEFFAGYHRAMYRYVEEATVFPFSSGCLERGSGGVAVSLLRLSRFSEGHFAGDRSACMMRHLGERGHQVNDVIDRVVNIFLDRNRSQPKHLQAEESYLEGMLRGRENGFDRWREVADRNDSEGECRLRYIEYFRVESDVVLGDLQHERAGRECVYKRVPTSLRTVEEEIEIEFTR